MGLARPSQGLAIASPSAAAAAAPDPQLDLGEWKWSVGYVGSWRFDSSFPTTSWMRTAATNAINTISHSVYANPDFEYTTGSSANVTLQYLNSTQVSCTAGVFHWKGCALTTASSPFTTWWVRLASNFCWTNGAGGRTCGSDTGAYDVQTVTLNEMGHVNILGHHVNPAYSDAVVQAAPVSYPNTNWQMRTLRWADADRLNLLYGCPSPCPNGPLP